MCVDPVTGTLIAMGATAAISAGSSIMQGQAANDAARLEADQHDNQRIMSATETSSAVRLRMREFEASESNNRAAMAISGLTFSSFDGLTASNERTVREDLAAIETSGRMRETGTRIAAAGARQRGKAAQMAGYISAASTIASTAFTYEINRTPSLPSLFQWGE